MRNAGQGTVEMILTMFAFFTIVFMYVQVAMSFAVANYIQYATFMAARALLSSRTDEQSQKEAARSVLEKMLQNGGKDRFGGVAKPEGEGADFPGAKIGNGSSEVQLKSEAARNTAWEQGVSYRFKVKLYMMPLVSGAKKGAANQVTLESQSYLGRDPSEAECFSTLERRRSNARIANTILYDNGC